MMITSTSNPTVKHIRKLMDRKERQLSGLFYLEGLRIVGEAIQSGWEIEMLVVCQPLLTSLFGQQVVQGFIQQGGQVVEVSESVFRSFSPKDGPQGIAAVGRQRWSNLDDISFAQQDLWVALDSVADPGNLGTIIRTNDSAGGKGIILLDHSTDPYDLSSVRGSMGALFSQTLVRASFQEFASWKKINKIPVIGTSDKASTDYHYAEYPSAVVLLMGSERQGLQDHHIALCDQVVRIPMRGKSDSLNLAIATALVSYEIINHWRDHSNSASIH